MMPKRIIQVCVRKRPLSRRERKLRERDILTLRSDSAVVTVREPRTSVDTSKYVQQHRFQFDCVFDESTRNEEIYQSTIRHHVLALFQGSKCAFFAFGQTGAGKTHTMFGNIRNGVQTELGICHMAGIGIFQQLEDLSAQHSGDLSLWLSYYEIYCGHLFDLLNDRQKVFAREDAHHCVNIAGLTETNVTNNTELSQTIAYGNNNRKHGKSGVNPISSRSHAILQMDLRDEHQNMIGKLTFIDLAGSERAVDADFYAQKRTKIEGAEINQSLLALKECIRAMDRDSLHTPFRQSKLTQVLKDSFIGNCQLCMIACVSPGHIACDCTLNTLRYASKVQEIDPHRIRRQNAHIIPSCSDTVAVSTSTSQAQSPLNVTAHPSPSSPLPVMYHSDVGCKQAKCDASHTTIASKSLQDLWWAGDSVNIQPVKPISQLPAQARDNDRYIHITSSSELDIFRDQQSFNLESFTDEQKLSVVASRTSAGTGTCCSPDNYWNDIDADVPANCSESTCVEKWLGDSLSGKTETRSESHFSLVDPPPAPPPSTASIKSTSEIRLDRNLSSTGRSMFLRDEKSMRTKISKSEGKQKPLRKLSSRSLRSNKPKLREIIASPAKSLFDAKTVSTKLGQTKSDGNCNVEGTKEASVQTSCQDVDDNDEFLLSHESISCPEVAAKRNPFAISCNRRAAENRLESLSTHRVTSILQSMEELASEMGQDQDWSSPHHSPSASVIQVEDITNVFPISPVDNNLNSSISDVSTMAEIPSIASCACQVMASGKDKAVIANNITKKPVPQTRQTISLQNAQDDSQISQPHSQSVELAGSPEQTEVVESLLDICEHELQLLIAIKQGQKNIEECSTELMTLCYAKVQHLQDRSGTCSQNKTYSRTNI